REYFLFFFSSRRRHTIFSRDWSSDVCSSDLGIPLGSQIGELFGWRATFLCAASLSGIACFAIAMWLPTISRFSAAGDVLGAALGFIGGLLAVCHSHERAVQVVKQLES